MDTDSFEVLPASAVSGNSATSVDDAPPPSKIGAIGTRENPVNIFTYDLSSTVTRRSACNQQVPFRFCNFKCETPEDGDGGGIGCRIK